MLFRLTIGLSIKDKEKDDGKWRWFLELRPEHQPEIQDVRQRKIGSALGNFKAMDYGDEYVSLTKGTCVPVAVDVGDDQGYSFGRNDKGYEGWFPTSFVELPSEGPVDSCTVNPYAGPGEDTSGLRSHGSGGADGGLQCASDAEANLAAEDGCATLFGNMKTFKNVFY